MDRPFKILVKIIAPLGKQKGPPMFVITGRKNDPRFFIADILRIPGDEHERHIPNEHPHAAGDQFVARINIDFLGNHLEMRLIMVTGRKMPVFHNNMFITNFGNLSPAPIIRMAVDLGMIEFALPGRVIEHHFITDDLGIITH